MTASSSSPTPRPWVAEIGNTCSKPSAKASAAAASRLRRVDLVGGDEHRLAGAAQQPGHVLVDGGDALAGVDHEHQHVALVHRAQGLAAHGPQDALGRGIEAAGVDHAEARPRPSRRRRSGDRG